jgi:hypothetical protein
MTTPVRAATAGAIGSIVALLLTFPVATVKVRLQAQRRNISASSSFSKIGTKPTSSNAIALISNIIKKEGFTKLYAGLLPALGKQAGTNFIFYYFFDILKRFLVKKKNKTSVLLSMLHGMASGACVQLIMLPTDLVVTRLMAAGSGNGYFYTLYHIIKTEGVLSLWSGLKPGMVLTVNPGLTTAVRNLLFTTNGGPFRNFVIGMISKAVASTMTYPYTLIKVQIQVNGIKKKQCFEEILDRDVIEKGREDMIEVFNRIVQHDGYLGLWRGLGPQLTNAVLKEALLNMVRLEIVNLVERTFNFFL